jgi:hypothetical protein
MTPDWSGKKPCPNFSQSAHAAPSHFRAWREQYKYSVAEGVPDTTGFFFAMRFPVFVLLAATLPFVLSILVPPRKQNARSGGTAIPIFRHNTARNPDGSINMQVFKADTQRSKK